MNAQELVDKLKTLVLDVSLLQIDASNKTRVIVSNDLFNIDFLGENYIGNNECIRFVSNFVVRNFFLGYYGFHPVRTSTEYIQSIATMEGHEDIGVNQINGCIVATFSEDGKTYEIICNVAKDDVSFLYDYREDYPRFLTRGVKGYPHFCSKGDRNI